MVLRGAHSEAASVHVRKSADRIELLLQIDPAKPRAKRQCWVTQEENTQFPSSAPVVESNSELPTKPKCGPRHGIQERMEGVFGAERQ